MFCSLDNFEKKKKKRCFHTKHCQFVFIPPLDISTWQRNFHASLTTNTTELKSAIKQNKNRRQHDDTLN